MGTEDLMEPTKKLIEELYREEIASARTMTPEEKFLAGARLFDYACSVTMAGIRHQYPQADEREVLRTLRERLESQRRLEEEKDSLYRPL
jgi:hypothetical protein